MKGISGHLMGKLLLVGSWCVRAAGENGAIIRMRPGVCPMADHLTAAEPRGIREGVDRSQSRPPVPMFVFRGDGNQLDLTGGTIGIISG